MFKSASRLDLVTLPRAQVSSDFNLENHGPGARPNLRQKWIVSLNCILPGMWADPQTVSQKAAQAYDAPVEFVMWYMGVTLLLPCQSKHLGVLRCFFLGCQFRSV
jgi:hypothetical protein